MKVLNSTIAQASSLLKARAVTASDLCKASFERAEKVKELNAFVSLTQSIAENQAHQSDSRYDLKKPSSPLDGVTIAIKDNYCTKDVLTTCASEMLKDFVPPYNATVVDRLLKAGGVLVGKCNLDEFAMGSGTVDSIHGPTRNVWGSDLEYTVDGRPRGELGGWRIAGGSSGGCAVAVATGSAFVGLGSDTGGSTRNPASCCGVVGLKPTYGSVSRHGLIPLVNSMDVPGILARCVEDAAVVYNVICGRDPKDPTTVAGVEGASPKADFDPKGLRIGIPVEYYGGGVTGDVVSACEEVARLFQQGGASVAQVSMPHTEHSIACYSVLNQCEVASNMARYDGLRYGLREGGGRSTHALYASSRARGLNQVVRGRILAGNYFLLHRNYARYFEKALRVRRLICEDFEEAWRSFDALLTPTTPSEAPLLREYTAADNREQCSRHDFCTQPVNMAGCPAISIPIKLSRSGLPLSAQLIGPNFRDGLLLSIAKWVQDRVCFPKLELVDAT